MMYRDGKNGTSYMKRFTVTGVTRDKEYDLTVGNKNSLVYYFTANPNGEAEVVTINLRSVGSVKKLKWDIDFSDLLIKGRGSKGNILSKYAIKKIELKEKGISTLKPRKIWFDDNVQRINVEARGELLGEFSAKDQILTINQKAIAELKSFDISNHFDDDMLVIEKLNPKKAVTAIYFDGGKNNYFVKRFLIEHKTNKFNFITEHKDSFLEIVSTDWRPQVELVFVKEKGKDRKTEIINLEEFIAIKGAKAIGNRLTSKKIKEINLLSPLPYTEVVDVEEVPEILPEEVEEKVIELNTEIELNITNDIVEKDNNTDDDDGSAGQITLEL